MRKISNIIIEPQSELLTIKKHRNTIRGIVIKNNQILMVYSKKFNDYTFPGGGIKDNESHLDTLKRELKEEVGALEIENINPYGFIEEKRFGIKGTNSVYLQTSYYYLLEISKYGTQDLIKRELAQGLTPKWITPKEAIKINKKQMKNNINVLGMQTVLIRENIILKDILKNIMKEENKNA
ncbi:MAG: NUDIX domain-containing protein [Acholeplasmataceae bacterium]